MEVFAVLCARRSAAYWKSLHSAHLEPLCDPNSHSWGRLFQLPGVSTKGVRHSPTDDFPSKRSSKVSFQTSPEVRHQFRHLHSGNRWCLTIGVSETGSAKTGSAIDVRIKGTSQLRASSDGSSDATSKASFPLHNTEARHQGNFREKLNRGVSKPGCFPLFSGQVQIVSRTLSGQFLVGALNRPRKRKRTNRENPRTIPEQIGKVPEKSGKSQKGQKRTKKEGQVQIGKPPRLKHPRLAALEI